MEGIEIIGIAGLIEKIEKTSKNIYEAEEIAEMLSVSEGTVYRSIRLFMLNAIQIETRYIITKRDLTAFLLDIETGKKTERDKAYKSDILERIFFYYNPGRMLYDINTVASSLHISETLLRNIVKKETIESVTIFSQLRIRAASLAKYLTHKQTFGIKE